MATPPGLTEQREPIVPRFEPGFFTEASAVDAPTRWKLGDKARFNGVNPEKIGGWVEQQITGATHRGVARRIHEWSSLDGEAWIAYGTNSKLYVINRGIRYDITPVRRTIVLTNPFSTTNGSPTVTVTDASHSSEPGDAVRFTGASAVAGITITGEYVIQTVIDGDTYTITHTSNANATTTGGGTVTAQYDINAGSVDREVATGWGACSWGASTWGTARSTACSGVFRELRTWSLDNFGEDLIASPRGGAVYWWDKTTGPLSRAVLLESAPRTNQRVLISNSGGQIICLGAFDDVANTPDPMLIRVGAEESLTDFTISDVEDDTVFEERMATGSQTITGVRTRAGIFISTDAANYIMQEDQFEIFRLTKLGEGNTACGPNAMLEIDGIAYMMTPKKFFKFDGVLEEIPCDVWRYVFQGTPDDPNSYLDVEQIHKVYSWYNEKFSEIWWHYPSVGGEGENDRYVIYNKKIGKWYFGTIVRTAANRPGPTNGPDIPIAFDTSGKLFIHETGVDEVLLNFGSAGGTSEDVVLLLHADGTNGSTTIVDDSGYGNVGTLAGGAALGTAQAKFGSASLDFTGVAATLTYPVSAGGALDIFQGDFTIEMWVYITDLSSTREIFDYGPFATNQGIRVYYGGGQVTCQASFYNGWADISTVDAPVLGWNHIAICRAGAQPYIALNGVNRKGTSANWTTFPTTATSLVLAKHDFDPLLGYIDEVRITRGLARYTGLTGTPYTLPTAPGVPTTEITNPIDAIVESHDAQIAEGGKAELHLSKTMPDMMRQTGTVLLYLKGKHAPNDATYVTKGPYAVETTTKEKGIRITARQIALRFRSNTVGADWHLGAWRFYGQPDKEGS